MTPPNQTITGDWVDHPGTQLLCAALTNAGYHALFVGGCVRNALLGVAVNDIDIATDAHPNRVIEIAELAGLRAIPTGIDHGTVTVIAKGRAHEITTFRDDVKTDGRHAVVAFSDNIVDDARRRDFTMNALYADASGAVIDPLGGLGDLRARRVRFIENPVSRIREDYLRILRFFRFHAWYGDPDGGIDRDALAAIAANLDGLAQLSNERVGAEMKKLLAAHDPAPSVAAMRATGVLMQILPGCDDRGLPILIHHETAIHAPIDPIRRLACLGGDDIVPRLRLSKSETRELALLRDEIGTMTAPHALGYAHGINTARDILLLRSTIFETPFDGAILDTVQTGANAVFPIAARDLMPEFSGPKLGQRLKLLQKRWIDAEFRPTREQLLASKDT